MATIRLNGSIVPLRKTKMPEFIYHHRQINLFATNVAITTVYAALTQFMPVNGTNA